MTNLIIRLYKNKVSIKFKKFLEIRYGKLYIGVLCRDKSPYLCIDKSIVVDYSSGGKYRLYK